MLRSRSHNVRLDSVSTESHDAQRVMETLGSIEHDIDTDEVLLVGSAALTLYGINLLSDPLYMARDLSPRPHDVDFAATTAYVADLYDRGSLAELPLSLKNNVAGTPILRLPTAPLPIDFIAIANTFSNRLDNRFRKQVRQESVAIPDSKIRVASLGKILSELKHRSADPKAASDRATVRSHIGK